MTDKTKICLLGTGTSQGIPVVGCQCAVCRSLDSRDKRLRTSAFVEVGDCAILIDSGPDLRQQLLANQITKVDAILLTHEHKDHLGGLDDIRPLNFMTHKQMDIYGQGRVLDVVKKDYDYAFKSDPYPGVPEMRLHKVADEPFRIGDIEVIPIKVKHLLLPILGYRIGNMAYITDASFISDKELSKLTELKILIINALRIKKHYSHFNLAQALAIIEKLKPEQAYLTHISHDMGCYADINPTLPAGVVLGVDGMRIEG
jgi:phosphoribosyl 1,2-cyclic phosphate phosphodiesterase